MSNRAQTLTMLLVAALTIATVGADAATSFTSSANVNIQSGFGVGKNADLEFGFVVPAGTAGTVIVPASFPGTRSKTGSIQLVTGGAPGAAQFTVTKSGGGSPRFDVTLPATALTISNGAGGTMTVDTWTQNALTGPPWSAAPFTLYVGATLHVGPAQPTGTYTGIFTITVNQH